MTPVANPPALYTPAGFARVMLGHDIWSMQAEILESLRHHRRIAVKSCHASGKTFIAADAVLWWIANYPDGIAVTTAPTWSQIKKVLWGEIRRIVATSKLTLPKPLMTELKLAEGNYAIGLSTNESARFQGFHAGHVLLVFDEAPGVDNVIWEAAEGLRSGGDVSSLGIGNPLFSAGPFFDAFTTQRNSWHTYTISAFDTPNLQNLSLEFVDAMGVHQVISRGRDVMSLSEDELNRNPRHYLCTRRWVKEMYETWGPEHHYFQSRVLGEFPTQSDTALIPLAWLERSRIKDQEDEETTAATLANLAHQYRPRAGLDVAGPGDDNTVLKIRLGPLIVATHTWPVADPRGEVVAALMPYKSSIETINVDSIGIGWGMYVHLRDIFGSSVVKAVNVGEAARDAEKFVNRKAEYYWGLRLRAQAGDLRGLDERTIGELSAIQYSHNSRGQIEIESKDDLRKRGMKSPDNAEACMLAFAETPRLGMMDFYESQVMEQRAKDKMSLEQYRTQIPGMEKESTPGPGPSPLDVLNTWGR